MASGTSNTETFTHAYFLYGSKSSGFSVGNQNGSQPIVVTDVADNSSDDTTQLGDIANDKFTENLVGGSAFSRTYVGQTAQAGGVVGTFTGKKGPSYTLYTNNAYAYGSAVTVNAAPFALCFGSGTGIATPAGRRLVEDLNVGDEVVTAEGECLAIKWIGRRVVGRGDNPLPFNLRPVKVSVDAFGPGMPERDLFLSPGHPVLVGADEVSAAGGSLVPIMCLVNGTSVRRVERATMTYWHIELERHDILLAEGLPAESYLEMGSRAFFETASSNPLHDPDAIVPGVTGRCRPVVLDGPVVEAARRSLENAFACRLGDHCGWSSPVHEDWVI